MSILIQGVRMPPDDRMDLVLHIRHDGTVLNTTLGKAIELPPHGRLIDADAIMDGWMNLREATKYGNKTKEELEHSYSTMMMYEIAGAIEDAPTIIPADGGAGNG